MIMSGSSSMSALGTFVREARDATEEAAENRNAGSKTHEPGVPVARMWHAGPAVTTAGCEPTSGKPPVSWAGEPRAGDGNRTRMTSSEGFGYGVR
jgi:hypothetical protein